MSRSKITAVMIVRDEAENIIDALKSLEFADQIIVADTGSTDNTMKLAVEAGAEVHSITFNGFGTTKNRALDLCNGEWIFSMDADERVTPELAERIVKAANLDSEFVAFKINRLTCFIGKPIRHSGWYPDHITRLFKRDRARFSELPVHEKVEVDGPVGHINGLLLHYSYHSIAGYLDKLNEYSTLSAEMMYRRGRKPRLADLLFRPPLVFLKMYIFKAGFLDGYYGFLLAVLSSYHAFIKFSKLRQLSQNKAN